MIENIFYHLSLIDDALWKVCGLPIMMLVGLYLSWRMRFLQIRQFPYAFKTFFTLIRSRKEKSEGVHPLKAFFACVGGCIGIGNIVAVCTAIQIGGPGALLWVWITAFLGTILKYSEIYLGLRYREKNSEGGYMGGPMYFFERVYKGAWAPIAVCILLWIYGVEIYQFNVVTRSVAHALDVNFYSVTFIFLIMVIYATMGGLNRIGAISSTIIPIFVVLYLSMGGYVIAKNYALLPSLMYEVFTSAFTGSAATGGFVGSSMIVAASQGIRRGCYTGDVGIGYASIIHSESSTQTPEKQACLAVIDIFLDSFLICSTSMLLILITGVWKEPLSEFVLVQTALGIYFPYVEYFIPFFLFLLGYSTITAYFFVGQKCASYLFPKHGRNIYCIYAVSVLILFSLVGTTHHALVAMSITQVLLLMMNTYAIFKLREEIPTSFHS